jgi:predicted anti-sigma-YlaC factor YlaD
MKIECKNIQEQMPRFIAGTLSEQESKNVQSHIEACSVCRKYKEAMQRDDRLLCDYAESMRPRIARMEREVKTAIEAASVPRRLQFTDVFLHFMESKLTKLAAAAVLIIAASFSLGFAWGSRHDSERIRASLEVSLKQDLKSAVADSIASMREELRSEYQQELNRYAIQTMAASNAATNQLLSQLVAATNQSRSQELEGIIAVLGQIEANRLRENNELRKDLVTFASYTDQRLSQTQEKMAELWDYTRPGDNQENSNNNF